jgi:formamidopyrimidine-DNA glycosylase
MPELPEVETVCRELAQALTGKRIEHVTLRQRDLRVPFTKHFTKALEGANTFPGQSRMV